MVHFRKPVKISIWRRSKDGNCAKNTPAPESVLFTASLESRVLSRDLDTNLRKIKAIFHNCSDVVFREFDFAQNDQIKLALIYIDGLADKKQLSEQIMRTLALEVPMATRGQKITKSQALEFIQKRGMCIHQIKDTDQLQEVIHAVLSGDAVLLVDGHATAIINGVRAWEERSITDPEAEPTVRGPRDSFVESVRTNTALIRRRIKSPNLKFEVFRVGEVTGTDVVIAYIEGIADTGVIAEVKNRLERINIDGILESGYIEELINDSPWSPFPTINHTEKPDRVAGMLLGPGGRFGGRDPLCPDHAQFVY